MMLTTKTTTASLASAVVKDEVDALQAEEHGQHSLDRIHQLKHALMEVESSVASPGHATAGAAASSSSHDPTLFAINQSDFMDGGFFVPSQMTQIHAPSSDLAASDNH